MIGNFTISMQRCVLLSALLLVPLPYSAVSLAEAATAQTAEKKPARKVRRTATMREQVYKRLEAVQKLADEKNYAAATEKLDALSTLKRNSYEQAMTWNMAAYIAFNQENFPKAIAAYENITVLKSIPESLEQSSYYSLAKLYLMQEDYKKALKALNTWFSLVDSAGAEAYILRAQMYYQTEAYAKALPDVKKAVAINAEQGKKPRENWLLLERAVYYQNKDYRSMERCLKDLIQYYPKGQYWLQLSAVYNELAQPEKELATLETAYAQGVLTKETELVGLAQTFLSQDTPYKAAQVILLGMQEGTIPDSAKNLSLLGDSLMMAKEYEQAIDVMNRAADKSQAGKDFFKLAQIYTERQQWSEAIKNVDKALKLGELRNIENAYVLRGLILFNLQRLDEAKTQFQALEKYPNSEANAKQWLTYIEAEIQRQAYMQQQL